MIELEDVPSFAPGRMILLGAGASADARIPTTTALTQALAERISEVSDDHSRLLNYVVSTLVAHDAATLGADPHSHRIDVERVFSAIELLSERKTLEVTPFVAQWDKFIDQTEVTIPKFLNDRFLDSLEENNPNSRVPASVILHLLNGEIGPSLESTLNDLKRLMVEHLRDLIATTEKDVGHLRPLVTLPSEYRPVAVATLNYDLSVELAGKAAGVRVTTGIEGWTRKGVWDWPPAGVALLKLHGSVDWAWEEKGLDGSSLRHRDLIIKEDPARNPGLDPALVFGSRGKLRAEGPFLSLLAEFQGLLSRMDELTVIGYSFRDDHVNEVIRQWMVDADDRQLTIVDPVLAGIPNRTIDVSPFYEELLMFSYTNPGRVFHIGKTAKDALPDLFAPTSAPPRSGETI